LIRIENVDTHDVLTPFYTNICSSSNYYIRGVGFLKLGIFERGIIFSSHPYYFHKKPQRLAAGKTKNFKLGLIILDHDGKTKGFLNRMLKLIFIIFTDNRRYDKNFPGRLLITKESGNLSKDAEKILNQYFS
jgi:hypothetical protein